MKFLLSKKMVLSLLTILAVAIGTFFYFQRPSDVVVVDEQGKPIPNATVEPVTPSFNYGPITTDENGQVNLPSSVQEIWWVNVSARGYETASHVDARRPKPITIALRKTAVKMR